ncbi:MAG: AcvB/VirJ family lysyl-phosphatidylglycerol hydrolase [Mariniphaga sp.]
MNSNCIIKICRSILILQFIFYMSIFTTRCNNLLQQQSEIIPQNLPLTIYPSQVIDTAKPMIFMISGDGGWTKFDNEMCENLAKNGLPVVALDARKYFWNHKTAKLTSSEIERSVQSYMQLWNKKGFLLFGFSFGASIAPFIVEYFSGSIQKSLKGIYCLSPDLKADFEIHVGDMLGFGSNNDTLDVVGQMLRMKRFVPVCIFGHDEPLSVHSKFEEAGLKVITVPGSHHFNNDATKVAEVIAEEVNRSVFKK